MTRLEEELEKRLEAFRAAKRAGWKATKRKAKIKWNRANFYVRRFLLWTVFWPVIILIVGMTEGVLLGQTSLITPLVAMIPFVATLYLILTQIQPLALAVAEYFRNVKIVGHHFRIFEVPDDVIRWAWTAVTVDALFGIFAWQVPVANRPDQIIPLLLVISTILLLILIGQKKWTRWVVMTLVVVAIRIVISFYPEGSVVGTVARARSDVSSFFHALGIQGSPPAAPAPQKTVWSREIAIPVSVNGEWCHITDINTEHGCYYWNEWGSKQGELEFTTNDPNNPKTKPVVLGPGSQSYTAFSKTGETGNPIDEFWARTKQGGVFTITRSFDKGELLLHIP